jgi:ABC-type bacteriocin/lantibiotic exporter with double-glycine peptidase domain
MRFLGVELPLDELYSNIPLNENNAVNLFQLSQYASDCGLYTKPVEHPTLAALKEHLSGNSSAVLQYRYPNGRGHIVALLPRNGDIWLFDVPLRKFTISDEDLERLLRQSEGMVVVSKTPFPRPMIGQISLSRRSWTFVFITSLVLLTAIAFWIGQGSAQR